MTQMYALLQYVMGGTCRRYKLQTLHLEMHLGGLTSIDNGDASCYSSWTLCISMRIAARLTVIRPIAA